MKLIKLKILTVLSGLLTLNGLTMLFSGLIIQMNQANNFGSMRQVITYSSSTNVILFLGIVLSIGFGIAFFDGWSKIKAKKPRRVVKFF